MKKIGVFLIVLMLSFGAAASDPAIKFVQDLADEIIAKVLTNSESTDKRLKSFRQTFVSAVDLPGVGKFVLGTYWKKATPAEQQEFLKVFTDFTTKTWADRFGLYNGQQIVFSGSRNAGQNQLYVDSQIQNNPPSEVIWRLKRDADSYKIIDIIVEGVSMAMTYRNEYMAFLQTRGGRVGDLTRELAQKSAEFKFTTH
ncbi:MAG: ABC transporter substrate-binding protein [Alphaproteobacteria bacterium]|nr:ABC transporter substrate-binding protein [Alphaproteobacteria bacterium]